MGHVTVLGCGNIGGYLCDFLGRLPEVRRLTLVDCGVYGPENLRSQAISRTEVGKPKAVAVARRLKRLRPDLKIEAHFATLESLPIGRLDGDVICACLDSRISRMSVNEAAFRLGGRPWIDAGVLASELLARVDVYVPTADAACMECAFTEQHYASLEIRYPCQSGQAPPTASTNAPAHLGALAASLQAAECCKLLRGDLDGLQAGRQVLIGLRGHQHFISVHRRNPDCRFDHRIFAPEKISGGRSLRSVLFRNPAPRERENSLFSVPGQRLAVSAPCPRCGADWPVLQCVRDVFRPVDPLPAAASSIAASARRLRGDAGQAGTCPACGTAFAMHPFLLQDRVRASELPRSVLARSLRALGLRNGDLFTVTDDRGERHFLVADRSANDRSV